MATRLQETVVESLSLPDTKSSLLVLVMLPCMAGSVSVFRYLNTPCAAWAQKECSPMVPFGDLFNCFSNTVSWQKLTAWKPYRRSGEGDQLQQVSTFWKDQQYP